MITVYDKKTNKYNFNNNGLGVLNECIKAEITEELNGEYSLYLEYPTDTNKAKHLIEFNIIKAGGQLFRIYKVEREQELIRKIKVWARHIFYDLAFYYIEAVNLLNANMKEAIEGTIPPEAQGIFEMNGPERNIYPVKMKNVNGLEGLFKLLEIYGGELLRDNFKVTIIEKRGEEKNTVVKYGKNIKGLRAIVDTSEFATRIYPIGDNNLILQERFIEAEGNIANILPYPITRKVEFNGCKDIDTLRNLAKDYIKKASNPFINVAVNFLDLSKTNEYKNYETLFQMNLGDRVKVEHEKLGIASELRVIKKTTDLLNPINTKIELGNPLNTIINRLDFSSMLERLENKIEGVQNAVILKKNPTSINITSTLFYEAIIVGISAVADTNLTCNIIINGSASTDLTLYLRFLLDGTYYEFQPSQKLATGENIISLTLPMPQITAGQHVFVIEMKTSNGVFVIDKNNLQVFIEGRFLESGLSPSLPRAEVIQGILYSYYLNKLRNTLENLKTEITISTIEDEKTNSIQRVTYEEALIKEGTTIATNSAILMETVGISQRANENFYLNLIKDEWLYWFYEFTFINNTWQVIQYITIQEIKPITVGESGVPLGNGAYYSVEFSDPTQYKGLLSYTVELIE
ncbi:phage minor structural protein [Natranaerovirga pectinivora]|uniref:Phage minor structural protein n=1 Tax=Natranaerovirga pectinivora TaxID=682400 RepID=A0A4R3MQ85_9FIRM|nr:phage tail spike protein [Natranaerovirga pectinivora]TCT14570.1 phage minor structural protein [Natranaerovirga pectinivora]